MGGQFANIGVYSVVSPKVEVQILKAERVVSLRSGWVAFCCRMLKENLGFFYRMLVFQCKKGKEKD